MGKENEKWAFSIEEVSKRLGISRNLGYEMARQGIIPTVQLGRRKIVPLPALERLLEEGIKKNKT